MAFEKGNKLGKGREEGSKNVKTLEWEAFGKAIIEGNLKWMQSHLEELKVNEPAAAFDRLVDLMEYFKPKLSRQEQKISGDIAHRITFKE